MYPDPAAPLSIATRPPPRADEAPLVSDKSDPAPDELAPTEILIDPAPLALEAPLCIETDPELDVASPEAIDTNPDADDLEVKDAELTATFPLPLLPIPLETVTAPPIPLDATPALIDTLPPTV
jgi:hypothetical protein